MGRRALAQPDNRPARGGRLRFAGWILLAVLLATLLLLALGFGPRFRPAWLGPEATYLIQARSFWSDGDPLLGPGERERFEELWGIEAGPLELGGRVDGGRVFAVPAPYSLLLAPFVAASPWRGAPLLNVLLLTAAALLTARHLRLEAADRAPVWVALLLFGSVAFAWVFAARPEVLLLAATVAAFRLVYGSPAAEGEMEEIYRPVEEGMRLMARWLAAGALLALVALHHPFYLLLFLPAAAAVPAHRRRSGWLLLGAGAIVVAAGAAALYGLAGAGWSPWAGPGSGAEVPFTLDRGLASWNLAYFLAGRNVGLLPYFLPLLLLLGLWRSGQRRGLLLIATGAVALAFLLLEPFDFHGGPGTLANRRLLPLYGALFFVSRRVPRPGWLTATALVSALAMGPLWLAPRPLPVEEAGGYSYPSPLAERFLPYETTQQHLPSAGEWAGEDFWMRSLDSALRPAPSGPGLELVGGGPARILVASAVPLRSVYLELGPGAPDELEAQGSAAVSTVFRPDGGVGFELEPGRVRARHAVWWSSRSHSLYLLGLRLPEAPPAALRVSIAVRPRAEAGAAP